MLKLVDSAEVVEGNVEDVLEKVRNANLKEIFIIGYDEDGDMYTLNTPMDRKSALWLIESARIDVMTPLKE